MKKTLHHIPAARHMHMPVKSAGSAAGQRRRLSHTPKHMHTGTIASAALIIVLVLSLALTGCSSDSSDKISSFKDVNSSSFTLAAAQGSLSQVKAEKQFPKAEMQYFERTTDAFAALKSGKVDGFAFDKVILKQYCRSDDSVVIMDEDYGQCNLAAGVTKDNTELLQNVNRVITQLRDDGTLSEMEDRWMNSDSPEMPELTAPENPSGTLRILTEGMTAPFTYIAEDGECTGFDIELGMRIAYSLGMDYSVQSMNFGALMPALNAGKGDIILSELNRTDEREKEISFSETYYVSDLGIAVSSDRYASSERIISMTAEELSKDMKNARIGVLNGSVTEHELSEKYPDAEIMNFNTQPDAIAALSAGKIDFAIAEEGLAAATLKSNNTLSYIDVPVVRNQNAFVISKNNTELRDEINEVLAEYAEDGTLDKIREKWTDSEKKNFTMDDVPQLKSGPVLKVACAASQEPMCFVSNGRISGFDCELIERIAYDLGMRVEYAEMELSSEIPAVQSGKADAALTISITDERKKEVDFTDVYREEINVAVVPNSNEKSIGFLEEIKDSFYGTFITENRWKLAAEGLWTTIVISVLSYILATMCGAALCMMNRSGRKILHTFSAGYVKIITGIPILVWLMILYYIVFKGLDIPGIAVAVIGFGLTVGASLSEVFETGLNSVDTGQREAAAALGFTPFQTFRKIVFPQAARHAFGLYKGHFVSLVKETAIVGYIAIMDLTKVSDIIRSRTYQAFFPLITTALIYFAITCIFIALLTLIERRFNPVKRRNILKDIRTRDEKQICGRTQDN